MPITDSKMDVYFSDVPFGTYAVKAFHDEDGNGTLNTNMVGVPTEDYGFSNNARGTFGLPKFQDARFEMDADEKTIAIRLK